MVKAQEEKRSLTVEKGVELPEHRQLTELQQEWEEGQELVARASEAYAINKAGDKQVAVVHSILRTPDDEEFHAGTYHHHRYFFLSQGGPIGKGGWVCSVDAQHERGTTVAKKLMDRVARGEGAGREAGRELVLAILEDIEKREEK